MRAKSAEVTRSGRWLALTIHLTGGVTVSFPVTRVKGIYAATYRAAAGTIHDVKVQDRGGTIAWPHYGINFSVAEMLPEYLGITSAKAAARRAGSVVSPRKASASKINGARGGRPRSGSHGLAAAGRELSRQSQLSGVFQHMTTAICETVSDQVVCFPGTWNLYCELLENQGDSAGLRISFDGEVIQITSPNYPHDAYAEFISRLIYEVCREWGVRMASAGTTTLKGAPDGGAQPDKSYHLLPRKDPALDPPADLVVEVDITTPATQQINKLKLYAALGVREFWRYRHRVKTFEAFILVEDAYQPIETSVILPGLPIDAVRQQILHADILGDDWETIQSWHQWLQAHKR